MDRYLRNITFAVLSICAHAVFIAVMLYVEPDIPEVKLRSFDIVLEQKAKEFVFREQRKGAEKTATISGVAGKRRVGKQRNSNGNVKQNADMSFFSDFSLKLAVKEEVKLSLSEVKIPDFNMRIVPDSYNLNGKVAIAGFRNASDLNWKSGNIKEYREAGGISGAGYDKGSLGLWYRRICKKVTGNWHIPPFKSSPGKTAICGIRFVIDRGGNIVKSGVVKSPGIEGLDERALYAVKRGAPYPPPPIVEDSIELYIEFDYSG